MQKETWSWTTQRLPEPARVARWGHFGAPVVLFATAGGDFQEVERFHLVQALASLIENGRIKVYSADGVVVRTWLQGTHPPEACARVQNLYDAFLYEEVVPLIRRDCQNDRIEPVLAGASLGAFSAVAGVCRHPDVFRCAIGLSGIYDLSKYLRGAASPDFDVSSPLHFLPALAESPQLQQLRRRSLVLATGEGDYEDPEQSRRLAGVLAARNVPHHLALSGPGRNHGWSVWREMLPRYLAEHV